MSDGSLAPVVAGLTRCGEEWRRLGESGQVQMVQGALLIAAALRADRPTMSALAQYEATQLSPMQAHDIGAASGFCLALEGRTAKRSPRCGTWTSGS